MSSCINFTVFSFVMASNNEKKWFVPYLGVIKYLGSQVAADGGSERDVVHRMNVGFRA